MSASILAATRAALSAAVLPCTLARAWAAFFLHGMEGVNRVVRLTPKRRVIPLLRAFGARVGEACDLESAIVLHNAHVRYRSLTIGDRCHVGKDVFLDLQDAVTLGSGVTVSMRAVILTHLDVGQSPLGAAGFAQRSDPVSIRDGAYIGAGAILLPGVEIGPCAVVGAGAIVTRSVPGRTVVAGAPARVLRRIGDGQPEVVRA